MSRPALPAAELRRFAGSPRAFVALLAVILVPLIYGGLYTWANESPTTRVDQIPAAVVNLDEMVTLTGADGKEQPVLLGRLVAGKLTASTSSSNYSWTLTDAATAESGLADGRFGAVLTIPKDFSRSATSTSGAPADARSARMQLRTNDAVNYLDGTIAKAIATATSDEAAKTVTEGYLKAMYAGYGTLHDQLATAADGAGKLAGGADELAAGAEKAATGADSLATGVGQLATGAGKLATGADALASGTQQAVSGVSQLSSGLSTLDSKVAGLPGNTRQLADGAAAVSGGVGSLAAGAAPLATGLNQLSTGLVGLSGGATQTKTGAAELATGVAAYTQGVSGLAAACPGSGAAPAFCAQLAAVAAQGGGLATGADGMAGGTAQVAGGLAALVPGAQQSAAGAAQISSGLSALKPGAAQLADGADQLADGMPALVDGIHQTATGAGTLADTLPALATGAKQMADGADQLAGGASSAATGAGELAGGLGSLADGSSQLGTGASDLSKGLGEGVSKIPTYSEAERAQLAAVAATPIVADVARMNAVKNNGAGLAPYFMALALWVGSLAVYLLLRPLSPRALASGAPSPLVALAGYLPGALLGGAQGVALAAVLQWWIGIGAASTWALVGVGALIGMAFVAVNQALVALLGAPGRFVAVILAGLQLTAAGGTYPVATAPGFFGWLHDALPLTYAVDALRRVVAGATNGIGTDLAVLVLTLVGALLVSTYAAHRQRTWTVRRLRPVTVV